MGTFFKRMMLTMTLVTLVACQDEETNRLRLVCEGMGGGSKMYVNSTAAYWMTGDSVNINGSVAYITATDEQASVSGSFSDDEYCIVFPGGLLQSRSENTVTLNMPAVYQYKYQYLAGVGTRQVLDAPMAYLGDAGGGEVLMRHLTGALDVQISKPAGLRVDRIVISTTQNRVLSGEMQFDLSNWTSMGTNATNATANNTIEMRFDDYLLQGTTVQIPIPAQKSQVNFIVRVEGHMEGVKYTFERTQSSGGLLLRGKLGKVNVDLNEGATGVTTSALFPTNTVGATTYYEIGTPEDLMLMSEAVCGTTYREDGDYYTRRWQYNGLYYKDANYILTDDVDMTGLSFTGIEGFNGQFNGNGKTISNLRVSGNADSEWPVCWGLFSSSSYGSSVVVSNLTISNITLVTRNSYDHPAYCGAVFGNVGGTLHVSNVSVEGYRIVRNASYIGSADYGEFCAGGFVGRQSGDVTVTGSSVEYSPEQEFTSKATVQIGGVTGYYQNMTATTSVNQVTVDFGTMSFTNISAQYFGGLSASLNYSDANVTAVNTTVRGTISFTGSSYVANKISRYLGSKTGVDVSGLTINGE